MQRLTWIALIFLFAAASASASTEGRRVALVIGNGAYQHTAILPNAPNDGRAVAEMLRRLDFEVLEGIDLDRDGTEDLIRQFSRTLRGADVGLFFYAGHGLQVSGANYLVPVDAELQDEADLDFEAIELNTILNQLERQPRTNIVLLDACRDNPLSRNLARSMGASRSTAIGRGLARISGSIGTLIAYATEPDNVALDGEGPNSPFTTALLQHIDTPGLEIRQMLTRVRQQVIQETDSQQVPWDHSSLTGDFFFSPEEPEPPPAPGGIRVVDPVPTPVPTPGPTPGPTIDPATTELMMWETVQNIPTPEQQIAALNLYLETYPQGRFAQLAEIQIAALSSPTNNPQPVPDRDPTPPAPAEPTAADIERGLGLNREDRRAVQSALTMLGYDTRGVDGVFGNNTRRALRDYQRARGQPVTGYLSLETLAALAAAAEVISDTANTCQWAFDGECDESRYEGGGSACPAGTDAFDCQGLALRGTVSTGPDSCEWAYDGECDEGRYVNNDTSLCAAGTDTTDCRGLALRGTAPSGADSCEWAFDGECDEARYARSESSLCAAGTDTTDCRSYSLRSNDPGNSCEWAYDGECDEDRYQGAATGVCPTGTDSADCQGYRLVGAPSPDSANSCQWAYDGECDEDRYHGNVSNACAWGTDTSDCRGLRLR